jgi:hypothetical protein
MFKKSLRRSSQNYGQVGLSDSEAQQVIDRFSLGFAMLTPTYISSIE